VCTSYLAAFATGDPERVASHVTEDFRNEHTSAVGRPTNGRADYLERLPVFIASLPGLRYDVEDVVAEGDKVVVAYTLRCHVNERDVAVPGVMRFEVRDGLIARRIDYWDSRVFEQQAGL
jgi:ketosteroid isomerase-like protein